MIPGSGDAASLSICLPEGATLGQILTQRLSEIATPPRVGKPPCQAAGGDQGANRERSRAAGRLERFDPVRRTRMLCLIATRRYPRGARSSGVACEHGRSLSPPAARSDCVLISWLKNSTARPTRSAPSRRRGATQYRLELKTRRGSPSQCRIWNRIWNPGAWRASHSKANKKRVAPRGDAPDRARGPCWCCRRVGCRKTTLRVCC